MHPSDPAPLIRDLPGSRIGSVRSDHRLVAVVAPTEFVWISAQARSAIVGAARARAPSEVCGLLYGTAGEPGRAHRIRRATVVANSTPEAPERTFRIAPDVVRATARPRGSSSDELVGFFHSHPTGPADPSSTDVEHSWPWYAHLIVAHSREGVADVAGYTLDPVDRSVRRLRVEIIPEASEEIEWPT